MIFFEDLSTVQQKIKLTYDDLSPIVQRLSANACKTAEMAYKELLQVVKYYMSKPYFVKTIAGCIIVCGIGLIALIIYKGKFGEFMIFEAKQTPCYVL